MKSILDTVEHIYKVQRRMSEVLRNLQNRSVAHDKSKTQEPELSGYEVLHIGLADVQYGTDAYRAALAEAKPTIDHHYAANTHHPEHWPDGINNMSLLDMIEMLADWKAAGERTDKGSMAQSLEVNRKRFNISDQLFQVMVNTAIELEWLDREVVL